MSRSLAWPAEADHLSSAAQRCSSIFLCFNQSTVFFISILLIENYSNRIVNLVKRKGSSSGTSGSHDRVWPCLLPRCFMETLTFYSETPSINKTTWSCEGLECWSLVQDHNEWLLNPSCQHVTTITANHHETPHLSMHICLLWSIFVEMHDFMD